MMVLREYHSLLVRKESASLCIMLYLIVIEEINDCFKHWILLHLCLLKWDEVTSDHISELEIFYKLSGLHAEFQVFRAYARKNLTHVKVFHDLANAIVEKDISTVSRSVGLTKYCSLYTCIICIF
jgi:hypothetical protein